MNKKNLKLLGVIMFAALSPLLYAQADDADAEHDVLITIDEVFLVDIEGASGTSITLGPESPTEAGEPVDFSSQTNSDLWLNYSSIKSSTGSDREVTVQIGGGGSLPNGMNLNVSAAADAGNGAGQTGTPVATITLTASPQDLINGIGSAYTATGTGNGHNLTYTLVSSGTANYADIDADEETTLSILYTITDD